ncbi:helix-turn-helix domain-containing protein [Streptomyces avermitilis]|uniref:helix-turn-helix domain-containing protein n=1 Tax=Streptomyces avermitilis TaxID=33903 RepID=UPI0033CF3EBF
MRDVDRLPSQRWGLEQDRERVAGEMRRLKEVSGLSFSKLAARTHYSRSSWERFLNGKKPVPRAAVEQFASALGDEAGGLLLSGGSAPEAAPEPVVAGRGLTVDIPAEIPSDEGPDTGHGRNRSGARSRPAALGAFVAGVAVGALAAAVTGLLSDRGAAACRPCDGCICPSAVPRFPIWQSRTYHV